MITLLALIPSSMALAELHNDNPLVDGKVAQIGQLSIDGVWQRVSQESIASDTKEAWIRPEAYVAAALDQDALTAAVSLVPQDQQVRVIDSQAVISLPMPNGSFADFRFVEAPVMAPELAARYPEIRTFVGQGIDDPHATVRFDMTPQGFHAQVLSPHGSVYIDPVYRGDNISHASYYKRDYPLEFAPSCTVLPNPDALPAGGEDVFDTQSGGVLRTYRLAVAATGEYTAFHGGTVVQGMAAIVTAVNRVTGIYESEVGVRMELVANNDLLVYTSSASDPYTNSNGSAMLSENISNVNSVIGSANYDIGHVFSTGGGGVAFLGVVCGSSKAGGVTGQSAPIGDPFYVDYVAHEMGHQFDGNHTFNGTNGSCSGGNRNGSTAYEPGSGSTIMAYAGICGADNLQSNSDPYFHSESYDEIRSFITSGTGSNCSVNTTTGNADPVVDAGPNYTIPASTPFELEASGSDIDGDPITYYWEERDLGAAQALSQPDNGSSPLFRSWVPLVSPIRTFPRIQDLRNNTTSPGERLPTTNRTMRFRCTARDNRAGGGGVDFDEMVVTVTAAAGPFTITSPTDGSEVWAGIADVTWDVAGTDGAGIDCDQVDLLLSTDGGLTYPIVLATGVANDGEATIVVPNTQTTTARLKIKASDNIFFDISNQNFTITDPGPLSIAPVTPIESVVGPGLPQIIEVQIQSFAETLVPGSGTLHYRLNGGAFQTAPLVPIGGDLHRAIVPRAECGDTPEFYFSAQGDGGAFVTAPLDAPTNTYGNNIGVALQVFTDSFDTDQGWTFTDSADSGQWERGVPVNNDRGDPPSDSDGSGSCLLTENNPSDINSDVDNGTVYATSPVIDMNAGGTISYDYWLNDQPTGPIGSEDSLQVEFATDAAGTNWQLIRDIRTAQGTWRSDVIEVGVDVPVSETLRMRVSVSDLTPGDVVEGGLDNVVVIGTACPDVGDGDFDIDGDRDVVDLAQFQLCMGQSGSGGICEPGDLDGDDAIDQIDAGVFGIILDGPGN